MGYMMAPLSSANLSYYAHSLEGRPPEEWEILEVHLREVAELASKFAAPFGAGDWGRLAGLWHDLGKYQPAFQRRIRGSREQVEHAGIGAVLAQQRGLEPLSFAIAGHHAGLANPTTHAGVLPLVERLQANRHGLTEVLPTIPTAVLAPEATPRLPHWASVANENQGPVRDEIRRSLEFWTRMVFSSLVDADYLATERFCTPKKGTRRRGTVDLAVLREQLRHRLVRFDSNSVVGGVRREVLDDCLAAAERGPGLFSLTVPTGGGKTLSSMAFALSHALRNNQRRIVVAIPFTSIIEQNAQVYRDVFGEDHVVEHHSNLDEAGLRERDSEAETARRLATENWDAAVVVTTNVQLFESIFANRPSRCRKLHNLARSVIILDEAQALPAGFLLPVLDVLKELVARYGCSVVLSTATQPALAKRASFRHGLEGVSEIVRDPQALARRLERVTVRWPAANADPVAFEDLAHRIAGERQVLAIVHRRADARDLAGLLPESGRYHLSALMCPAHRTKLLSRVRAALDSKEVCRLVSTQVVEAGVDIDFPVVYRALAGLDSLVQAAGRCNREGALTDASGSPQLGRFEIFRAPTAPPPGILRRGLETTAAMLARHPDGVPFGTPAATEEYFRLLFSAVDLDVKGVQALRGGLNFASTAEAFQLIPDATWPVVAPYGDSAVHLERHTVHPNRESYRALQPYTVQIYDQQLRELRTAAAVEEVAEGLYALTPPFAHLYDPEFGLLGGDRAVPDPAALIA